MNGDYGTAGLVLNAQRSWAVVVGDCREILDTLPEQSAQCVVTSPPYYGLRDYGVEPSVWDGDPDCAHEWVDRSWYVNGGATTGVNGGAFSKAGAENAKRIKDGRWRSDSICVQCNAWLGNLGLEQALKDYVRHVVEVFRKVRRVLRDDGTVWLNMGDSYSGSGVNDGTKSEGLSKAAKRSHPKSRPGANRWNSPLKPKDLMGIPWRVAFALQEDGWWLRRDIIWSKPNPMPESVTDRPTSSHEYMFLLTKSRRYYYDADAVRSELKGSGDWKEPSGWDTGEDAHGTIHRNGRSTDKQRGHSRRHAGFNDRWDGMSREEQISGGANLRSVWNIATQAFSEAHFATFPEKLVEPCIKAGSAPDDLVLDPFSGAGTTGLVAARFGRRYIGIELKPEYAAMSRKRITDRVGVNSPEEVDPGEEAQGRMF